MKLPGFYKLSIDERHQALGLADEDRKTLKDSGALPLDHADKMIENVIGVVHLPLAVATNFRINGKDMLAPMAIEEASVVAAASKAAKQTLPEGFICESDEPVMIGQMLIVDPKNGLDSLEKARDEIMELAGKMMAHVKQYGCGINGFSAREAGRFYIIDFEVNVGDAQGANMINSALEGIAPLIESVTGGKARMKILSNLAVKRRSRAKAVWKKDVVGNDAIEAVLDGIEFAQKDIFRTATHNKGIMNGIDAVAVATGNDWRSVEAGAHSFASMDGYKPLTGYRLEGGDLVGEIDVPLAIATVGPAVNSSPTASIAIRLSGASGSRELAMLVAAVGLANNYAALSALGTVGIQQGHMKLHARTIASQAGARGEEVDIIAQALSEKKDFNIEYAKQLLEEVRK